PPEPARRSRHDDPLPGEHGRVSRHHPDVTLIGFERSTPRGTRGLPTRPDPERYETRNSLPSDPPSRQYAQATAQERGLFCRPWMSVRTPVYMAKPSSHAHTPFQSRPRVRGSRNSLRGYRRWHLVWTGPVATQDRAEGTARGRAGSTRRSRSIAA